MQLFNELVFKINLYLRSLQITGSCYASIMEKNVDKADKLYQMYSAMIRSVYGVTSKFNRFSILFMVLFSDWRAHTLNLTELLVATFLFCFHNREVCIFAVIGHAFVEVLVILICHCVEGAKICTMLPNSSLNSIRKQSKDIDD